ncbi:MAG: radical SAM family heme chaperone HemW [Eubacteriales bacterium]|nr:radical SAM family heme chaperone HemW [Clostridiales bacterium]MDY5710021.1 radical SAM family heme chaperone HemW [Eubacteriales bacterium]
MAGIYLHVPFCVKKCAYCDFVSFPEQSRADAYFQALYKEIAMAAAECGGKKFDTVFLGGGTPSAVPLEFICAALERIRAEFDLEISESTIECNPGTVDMGKLAAYRKAGFNRISIGVQSFNDGLLRSIGRIHSARQAEETVKLARSAGFENINIDLMYGLPGQSEKEYIDSIERGGLLGVDHISAYSLILEEGTPLYDWVNEGRIVLPDDDAVYDMHRAGMARLESLGYKRYEISNYARPGCQCRHNINYWDVGEYIGLGLNSSSALRSKSGELIRFKNCESIDNYISEINCGRLPRENVESVGRENEMFEWIMLGLRKIEGVELGRFKARFGADVCEVYREAVNKLENMGWLTVDQRFMRLTDIGLDMQNSALMEFMQ